MRMFQVISRAHIIMLIPQGSAMAQQTSVNALPQQRNAQERQFAIQAEHARVNINNHINIIHMPKEKYDQFVNLLIF